MRGLALTGIYTRLIDYKTDQLTRDFVWLFRDGTVLLVPSLFIFDYNSIPRILWSVLPPRRYPEAGLGHDWLYYNVGKVVVSVCGRKVNRVWTRKECDRRYLEILEDLDAPFHRRRLMYRGVRLGGWNAWRKHKKARAKEARDAK